RRIDDAGSLQVGEVLVVEPEGGQLLQQPTRPGHDAVAPPGGEPAGEDLEHAAPVGRPVRQGGLDHRELVVVGQHRGARGHARHRRRSGSCSGEVPAPALPAHDLRADEALQVDRPWVTIVWNDPVNLMSYVTYVFQRHFGYPRDKAERLMRQVHEEGRATVSRGGRERMEVDVQAMHSYGLWATLARDGD